MVMVIVLMMVMVMAFELHGTERESRVGDVGVRVRVSRGAGWDVGDVGERG